MLKPFIDAHVHLNTLSKAKLELAKAYDAYFVSINTFIPFFIPIEEQETAVLELNKIEDRTFFITTFNIEFWNTKKWLPHALDQIKKGIANGAKGVKIWKNIGMDDNVRNPDGSMVLLDDARFDPIYQYLVDHNIPLLNHQAEPLNCWLPLEKMTVDSDREYFGEHPEYHMYQNNDFPSHGEHMAARDNVLRRFPKLRYVGLHLFSLEYDLAEVAKRLDAYPNSMTDLAERICHAQLQAMDNWQKVRDFFIKYQDRIIYGTDVIDDGSMTPEETAAKLERLWNYHWRFFATNDTMEAPEFKGSFKGLKLPEAVLTKIFHTNALKTYRLEIPNSKNI